MRLLVSIAILLMSIGANADGTTKAIARCAAIEGDAARLVCFDELARELGVDRPKSNTTVGKGQWIVQSDRSPIDDSVNVFLALRSKEAIKSGYNTVRPTLILRCSENRTEVYVTWDLYLGLDSTRILERFDSQKARTRSWGVSTDRKASFFRGGHVGFAKKMMEHEKLLLQVTPYGESPVMATFALGGLGEAIKPLREACHW